MSVSEIGHLHSRYVRLSDKFKTFWTYNQFAAGVYKNFLEQPLPYQIDFQKLYEEIRKSSDSIQTLVPNEAAALIEKCERDLQHIAGPLREADDAIRPSTLRRFLEKLKQQDEKIIFNLIKFYLYVGLTEGDALEKLDFLFTKVGEDFVEERGEYWSKDSLELRKQFQSLVSVRPVEFADQKEIVILIRTIRQMKEDIQQAESFDRLTSKNAMEGVRALKHRIGDQYFHPDVLLAIVDCNVATKNRFQKLYKEEEQRILDDSQKLFANEDAITRGWGATNPQLVDEMARFRKFKQEFDDSRVNSNVKHSVMTQLKASMNSILNQLDRGLDTSAPEDIPVSLLLEVQQADKVQNRFGVDPLLHHDLVLIIGTLEPLDPHLGEERIASSSEAADLRLEPWEVGAYLRLFCHQPMAEEDSEELLLLYLRSTALRMKIDRQARQLAEVPADETPDPELMEEVRNALERAKELDQLFGDFVSEGIYYADPKIIHKLYRSRFRLLRNFSGLWLIYDQRAAK
jgi:hypothetical protein